MASVGAQCIMNFILGHICQFSQLLRTGFALVFLLKLLDDLFHTAYRTYLIQRQTYNTALLSQSLENGLSDPPNGITDKLESSRLIKLFCCLNEADVAFGNQIRQRQTLILILFCHTDHKAKIGANQTVQSFLVTFADTL